MPRPPQKLRSRRRASPRVPGLPPRQQPPRGQRLRLQPWLPARLHQQPNRSRRQFDPQLQAQRQLKRLLRVPKSLRGQCRRSQLRAQLNQHARPLHQRLRVRRRVLRQHRFARQRRRHRPHRQRSPAYRQPHVLLSRERPHRGRLNLAHRRECVPLRLRRQDSPRLERRALQVHRRRDSRLGKDRQYVPCRRDRDRRINSVRARRKACALQRLRATRIRRAHRVRGDRRWADRHSARVDDRGDRAVHDPDP